MLSRGTLAFASGINSSNASPFVIRNMKMFVHFHSEIPEPAEHSGARGSGRPPPCRVGRGISWMGPTGWRHGGLALRTAEQTGTDRAAWSEAPPTFTQHQWNARAKGNSYRPTFSQVMHFLLWLLDCYCSKSVSLWRKLMFLTLEPDCWLCLALSPIHCNMSAPSLYIFGVEWM